MDLGLWGKSCVITGASRGIGMRVAEMLADEGANVLLVARDQDALSRSAASCDGEYLVCDITDADAGDRIISHATELFGKVDILVNSAGSAKWRDLDDVPDEDWQLAWETNVMGPLRAMRAAVPGMCERGWGRVVNVSSTAAKRPSKNMPEYSVTKAAQLSLSRLYADRVAADGVLVNAICPGPTRSEMWTAPGGLADQSAALSGLESAEAALEQAGKGRPIGRLAQVDEIAAAIVFLCSERASYVSGAAWSVDGGTVQVII